MRVPVDTTQPFNESEWQRPLRTYVDLSPPERNSLDNDRLAHAGHFEHPLFVRHTIALLALADRDEDEEDSRADQNNLLTRCSEPTPHVPELRKTHGLRAKLSELCEELSRARFYPGVYLREHC